jgi:hypothetical protein
MQRIGTYFSGFSQHGTVLAFHVHEGFFLLLAMGIVGYKCTDNPEK